ncbi:MAG: molecular chaperone TorD family protein [Planctomycetales bacterium]|nr:molecular chaperone TorD family protein [Planctomycetales bacterium]
MSDASSQANNDTRRAAHGLYALLSRLWLREPDQALLELLQHGDVAEACQAVAPELVAAAGQATCDDLAVDFCRIWLGPTDHLPPFQSVWEGGQFGGQAATSMQPYLAMSGYTPPLEFNTSMLDHLGVQLDWMRHWLEQFQGAQPEGAPEDFPATVQRAFFRKHLSWPHALLAQSESRADTSFYRAVVRLTRDFLARESRRLGLAEMEG